jgi:alpha-ribazole phosphatase
VKSVLVRHAEAEIKDRYIGSRSDPPLSEHGKDQAAALARRLSEMPFSTIYSSPLQRARETARALLEHHACPLEITPSLTEMDFGRWDGMGYQEINAQDPELFRKWIEDPTRNTPPDGESFSEFTERIRLAFRVIVGRHPESTVCIVSHGGPVRVILCDALGIQPEGIWSFQMDLAAFSLLDRSEGGRFVLRQHNDTCHLAPARN